MSNGDSPPDSSGLIRSVQALCSDPRGIRARVAALEARLWERAGDASSREEIRELAARHIIARYSNLAATAGGVCALSAAIPGLGTIGAATGGTAAEMALCMKFQVEMTLALSALRGRDITEHEEQVACFVIASLGAIKGAVASGAQQIGTRAFTALVQRYLQGATLSTAKHLFRRVGVTFSRRALEKAIPFGIGVVLSAGSNKALTVFVGHRVNAYFAAA
jgi:hypothetical protein